MQFTGRNIALRIRRNLAIDFITDVSQEHRGDRRLLVNNGGVKGPGIDFSAMKSSRLKFSAEEDSGHDLVAASHVEALSKKRTVWTAV
jgi:hypothetical protein